LKNLSNLTKLILIIGPKNTISEGSDEIGEVIGNLTLLTSLELVLSSKIS
jgi:hypothetical protein